MTKKIVLILLLISNFANAQTSKLNNYKYAIIPTKFSFQDMPNEYRLNLLTKMYLEQIGFTTYLDSDAMPEELLNNNCNKVYVDVLSNGNFITTKLKIILKDCKNTILYTSAEGKSKEKDYNLAYNEALRAALQSFKSLNYKYTPRTEIEIKKDEKEVNNSDSKIIASESFNAESNILFAQPITNGFQLVDNSPKVIMKIYKTSNTNCFIAIKEDVQGVLILKDEQWFLEYYKNQKLFSERVEVKF